jgi:hypothetical protein
LTTYRGKGHPNAADAIRASEDDASSRLLGIYFARVTNIDDPDKQGRIKTRFHWLEDDDAPELESGWLTRCVPFGGPTNMKRGRRFGMNWPMPEVGSLVVIAFNGGDVHDGVFFGQPEYHEDDVGAPPTDKDKHIDWSLRVALQNGFEFGVDTEGNAYAEIPGNLRIRGKCDVHISAKGILTMLAIGAVRAVSATVLRLLGVTVDQTNYPRPEEKVQLREMMIDAAKGPAGRKDPGIGRISDLE